MIIRYVESSLDCQAPFSAEVTFMPGFRLSRDERHEEIAFTDLLANLLVPGLATSQFAFVVPNLEAESRQRIPEHARRLAIRGSVAEEYGGRPIGMRRITFGRWIVDFFHVGSLRLVRRTTP